MKITKKSEYRYYMFAIADEIAWCRNRKEPFGPSQDYRDGFIMGLQQANTIIRKTKKMIMETNAEQPARRVSAKGK